VTDKNARRHFTFRLLVRSEHHQRVATMCVSTSTAS
jgi:hypothetical protein